MKCSLGISNFLEEISTVSYSVVFLYFFALIAEEGFLISPCYSLELSIQMRISFLFSFAFGFPSFTAICKASSDSHFAFLHLFSIGMVLIPVSCTMSRTSNENQFLKKVKKIEQKLSQGIGSVTHVSGSPKWPCTGRNSDQQALYSVGA